MSVDAENSAKPDVESIMAGIRSDLASAAGPAPDEPPLQPGEEAGLHDNLAAANRLYAVGTVEGGGAGAAAKRVSHKMLGPLIGQINDFNARIVRVLNEVVKMLEGEETASSSRVLQQGKRRIEMLSRISDRLAELDALKIDERLRRIEEKVEKMSRQAPHGAGSGAAPGQEGS